MNLLAIFSPQTEIIALFYFNTFFCILLFKNGSWRNFCSHAVIFQSPLSAEDLRIGACTFNVHV